MRIAQLHLRAYGPFDGAVLDFDRPAAGLQIVYGPNERGKSTAMRAIAALLFGFPTQTDDRHAREYGALRVGAVLEDGAGRHALMRRKANRSSLCEFDPATGDERVDRIIDQAAIDAMLGGIDERRFLAMHGLDAERLREGGRALVTPGSDLGAMLFEAASGLSRLRAVADTLRRDADELFVPRGQKPLLNATLSELDARQKAARDAGTRPRDWAVRRDALARADEEVTRLEASLRDCRGRLGHLELLRGLGPQVARLGALTAQLAALSTAPLLPVDAAERVAAWSRALDDSQAAIDDADALLARVGAQIDALVVSRPHLESAIDIVQLAGRLDEHEAARRGWPALQADAQAAAVALRRAVAALGDGPAGDGGFDATAAEAVAATIPSVAHFKAARTMLQARRAAEQRRADAAGELADATRVHDAARAARAAAGEPPRDAPLVAAVDAAAAAGDVEARVAAMRARLDAADVALDRQAAALGVDDRTALARLRLPSASEVERAEARERDDATLRATLRARRDTLVADVAQARAKRGALAGQRAVLGRDALDAARGARDGLLREALDSTGASSPLAALGPAIGEADRIADARFDDASRLAEIESLGRRIDEMDAALREHDDDAARRDAEARVARDAWDARLAALGVPVLDPAGHREWSARHARWLEALQSRDQLAAEHRAATLDVERHLRALQAACAASGLADSGAATLAAALAHARRLLDDARTAANRHARLRESFDTSAADLARRRATLDAIDADLAAGATEWAALATRFGLGADASSGALAVRLDALEAVRDAHAAWEAAERGGRLAAARIEQFRADAAALAHRLGVEPPAPGDEPRFVAGCDAALRAAERARDERVALQARLAATRDARDRQVRARDEARAGLAALREQAGVDGLPALQDAVARSTRRRTLQRDAEAADAVIREVTGTSHEALVAEAAGIDATMLRIDIDNLRAVLDADESARDAALADRQRARVEYDAIDGDGEAARAAEAVRERLAAAGRIALDCARLRLARELLEQAVQRHAQRAQGPMLAAASRWFARLTDGRWRELRADWAGDAQILVADGADGLRLPVERLSEGAADALFLALRLAAIEVRLDSAPPVPLLLDDVLSSFDDARASLALQALAELGRRNQVVYFTHHAHLVELARRAVPEGEVSVRELVHRPVAA